MNYYSYMKGSTANGGLIDIYPNIKVPINKKHSLTAFYHKFYLANPVMVGAIIVDDTDLGSEVDLMYTYKIMDMLTFRQVLHIILPHPAWKRSKKLMQVASVHLSGYGP